MSVNHWAETVRSKVGGSAEAAVEPVSGEWGEKGGAWGEIHIFRVFAHGRQAEKPADGPSAGGFAWINGNPMRL